MGDSNLRRGRYCLVIGLGALLIFSACSSGGGSKDSKQDGAAGQTKTAADSGTPVAITNFTFDPKDLSVPAGTKVIWTNKDDTLHNVQDVSALNTPISPDMAKDATFSITYTKPGTYNYVCGLHTYMTGTVKVT